jgi:hypothetical protein
MNSALLLEEFETSMDYLMYDFHRLHNMGISQKLLTTNSLENPLRLEEIFEGQYHFNFKPVYEGFSPEEQPICLFLFSGQV